MTEDDRPSLDDYPGLLGEHLRLMRDLQRAQHEQVQAELAEIRDGMIELDHGKASTRRVNELQTIIEECARGGYQEAFRKLREAEGRR